MADPTRLMADLNPPPSLVNVSVRFPPDLYRRILVDTKPYQPLSDWIRLACIHYLERTETANPGKVTVTQAADEP